MTWHEVRTHYPEKWLLVKAIKAHSSQGKRVLDQLSVVETFADSVTALKQYAELHHEESERELYVFHASRQELDITERNWLGIRGRV